MTRTFVAPLLAAAFAVALAASDASAQTPTSLEGFLGIPFGTPKSVALAAFDRRGGMTYSAKLSSATVAAYTGGTFAGQRATITALCFTADNRFAFATVWFERPHAAKVIERYNELHDLIFAKYGRANEWVADFDRPYSIDDDRASMAISIGKGDVRSIWSFPVFRSVDATDSAIHWDLPNNNIVLRITDKLDVIVTYRCGELADREERRELEVNIDDL